MAFIRPIANGRGLLKCLSNYDFTRTLSTTTRLLQSANQSSSSSNNQKQQYQTTGKSNTNKPLDDIQYIVKFKEFDVKKIFKQFYSVYGPLFVVCHIGMSLISLGFFCSVTWMLVDPTKIIPDFLQRKMTDLVLNSTGTGSKFVVAYALHKLILPLRLGGSVWATRRIATRVEFFRNRVAKAKSD